MKKLFYLLLLSIALSIPTYGNNSLSENQVMLKICKAFDDTDSIFYCFTLSSQAYTHIVLGAVDNHIFYTYEPWNSFEEYGLGVYGDALFTTKPNVPYVWCHNISDGFNLYIKNMSIGGTHCRKEIEYLK